MPEDPAGRETLPESRGRLALMGTGPFAVPSFEALRTAGYSIPLVVTRPQPTRGSRRKPPPPSPVRQWAQQHHLPLFDPESINDPDAVAQVARADADLLVVCDYGQILSPAALATTPRGGVNLHGSLLPAYRGAAPVQWAVYHGDAETGVSVIHMTPRLDGGPIVARRTTAIGAQETAGSLEARLAELGVPATLEAVQRVLGWDGNAKLGERQDRSRVSKAPRLTKQDGAIDWQRTATEVDCQVRAMQPWPTAFTWLLQENRPPQRLMLAQVSPGEANDLDPPRQAGEVKVVDKRLYVGCGAGYVIIQRLQPAGKREMAVAEFLNGHPLRDGARLAPQPDDPQANGGSSPR